MPERKTPASNHRPPPEPFVTIDDALEKAQELAGILSQLGAYKHPLGVRKGRKGKGVSEMASSQQSKQLKGAGRTYFFDVKETREGKPYLVITESRKGSDDRFERSRVNVFPEDAEAFGQVVAGMMATLERAA